MPTSAPGQPDGAGKTRMELVEVYLDSEKIGGAMIQLMEFRQVAGP